jgi:hypothetical protein
LDVKEAGEYEVEAMYACEAADVGSVLEVRSGKLAVQATLEEAFDPPLKDQDDRVPRDESYDKAFRPLSLGTLHLEAGRQPLVLKCLSKAGKRVAEIRALRLNYTGKTT